MTETEHALQTYDIKDLISYYENQADNEFWSEDRERCLATAFYLKQFNTLPFDEETECNHTL